MGKQQCNGRACRRNGGEGKAKVARSGVSRLQPRALVNPPAALFVVVLDARSLKRTSLGIL